MNPSVRCRKCGRELKLPISRSRGMGGSCWAKTFGFARQGPTSKHSKTIISNSETFKSRRTLLEVFGSSAADSFNQSKLEEHPETSKLVKWLTGDVEE